MPSPSRPRLVLAVVVFVVAVSGLVTWVLVGRDDRDVVAPVATTTTATVTTSSLSQTSAKSTSTVTTATSSTVTTSTAPPTSVSVTTAPLTSTTVPACCRGWTTSPYRGVGTWVDVFDWTVGRTKGNPPVGLDAIDEMAAAGIRTLYIQTARVDTPNDIEERPRLETLIRRAHERGLHVVTWYLPTFEDVDADLRRLVAAASLGVDGLSVNVESTAVADPAERSRRLVDLSRRLKERLGGAPLATVVLNPFTIEEIRSDVWPDFPWSAIDPYYDVWQPMAYVTYRQAGSTYRDAETYTRVSIDRMRSKVGGEPIHPVTGIGDQMTNADLDGYVRAAVAGSAFGGSIYDWNASPRSHWARLAPLNP